ncbi:hypothetical protein V8C40DRAFT_242786, partial [Trichoderma camerunense]
MICMLRYTHAFIALIIPPSYPHYTHANSYHPTKSHVQNISKRAPGGDLFHKQIFPSSTSSSSKVSRTNAEMLQNPFINKPCSYHNPRTNHAIPLRHIYSKN